jgi:hypothetical protein
MCAIYAARPAHEKSQQFDRYWLEAPRFQGGNTHYGRDFMFATRERLRITTTLDE